MIAEKPAANNQPAQNNPDICQKIEAQVKEAVNKINLMNSNKHAKQNLENSEPVPADSPSSNNQPAQNEPDFDLDIKIDENDF